MNKKVRFNCIVTNGQLGNFFAFDSFLTDKEKKSIKKIIITPIMNFYKHKLDFKDENGSYQIINLVKNNKFYSKNIIFEYVDNLESLKKATLGYKKIILERFLNKCHLNKWYLNESINMKNSSFMKIKNADIDKFNLPKNYCVIVAWSKRKEKKFSNYDWKELIKILKIKKIKGVLLNNFYRKDIKIPKNNFLIDLTEKTSLFESIEITKNAKFYVGINGCLSIIAMQKYPNKCMIKTCLLKKFQWYKIYYPKIKNKKTTIFRNITTKKKNNIIKKDSTS